MITKDFKPDWTSAPGETIIDILDERGLTVQTLARSMSTRTEYIHQLIGGEVPITYSIACHLQAILGSTAEFWLTRENQYREGIRILEEESWLKDIPLNDMIKFGWIKRKENQLQECLTFFNTPTIRVWREKYSHELVITSFRTSSSLHPQVGSVAAWLQQGEIMGKKIQCNPWNPVLFKEKLYEIRSLTRKKNPGEFLPTLKKICAECGVALAIVRTPSGCRASGATKFITPERGLMLLSFRYLSDDQFWFTFFHEAGHLLLHKEKLFLEDIENENPLNKEEIEANTFATDVLIPPHLRPQFNRISFTKRDIIGFATTAGISPGIVVGQLQHLGRADFKNLNGYKRYYKWEDIIL